MSIETPDHWNGETQRLATKLATVQAQPNDHQALGMLAIATELADLRKVLAPETRIEVREPEFDYEAIGRSIEAMRTSNSVPEHLMPKEHETSGFALHRRMPEPERTAFDLANIIDNRANIRQVGWYCPGGHAAEDSEMLVAPNLRLEDPCAHGVPVYVLVRSDD